MIIKRTTQIICFIMAAQLTQESDAETAFLEQNGLIVIELESLTNIPDGWAEENEFDDISGKTYHRYNDDNEFSDPGEAQFDIYIFINNPGTYQFRWRNLIAEGSSTTDANDSWLRIIADAFYGLQGNDSIVCPKGYNPIINDCPVELDDDGNVTPEGSGRDGWFKVYRSGSGLWKWSTRTSDNDAHEIYARFDSPGLYLIQISGRSKNHAIDRIVLNEVNYPTNPLDLKLPESAQIDADIIFTNDFES